MHAVIYRGFVYPEKEQEYIEAWQKIALYFIKHRGAIGSALHKTDQGEYIAYSRWPSKEVRDLSWQPSGNSNIFPEINEMIETLIICVDKNQPYEEINMNIVEDFLNAP